MGNAVNAYSKGGKSGLSSGSILAGTLKHFTFFFTLAIAMSFTPAFVDTGMRNLCLHIFAVDLTNLKIIQSLLKYTQSQRIEKVAP